MDCGGWLSDFFATISEDARITATHTSLYLALFNHWQEIGCPVSMELDRTAVMAAAKISARSTYDKTISDLHDFGYLRYEPVVGRGRSRVGFKKL